MAEDRPGFPGFHREIRPISPYERRILAELLAGEPLLSWLARTLVMMLLGCCALYFAYLLVQAAARPRSPKTGPLYLGFGLVALVTFALSARTRRKERAREAQRRRTLGSEYLVDAARIEPSDVAQLDYPGGRHPTLVLLLGPTHAVALYLVDVHNTANRLPSTAIEYVCLHESRHTIRMAAVGVPFPEVRHLDGPATAFDERQVPECEPFALDWSAFLAGSRETQDRPR
jgi:hypothetical protein